MGHLTRHVVYLRVGLALQHRALLLYGRSCGDSRLANLPAGCTNLLQLAWQRGRHLLHRLRVHHSPVRLLYSNASAGANRVCLFSRSLDPTVPGLD